jgi:cytochrome c553
MNGQMRRFVLCAVAFYLASPAASWAGEPSESPAQRGYHLLTTHPYLSPDFDQETFDSLWQSWEEPARSEAEAASPDERRRLAFERYGLTYAPDREGPVALQYVDDGRGGWVMNCLACHTGEVEGRVVPGAPNTRYALAALTDDVRQTKLRLGKPLARMEVGGFFMPLGTTVGTTNAVMFGVSLMAFRDADLNVVEPKQPPPLLHHDLDAPAWWHVRKKRRLYADGFVAKDHRALMQFMLVPVNGPDRFRQWEDDYRDVLAYIESLEPPASPWPVDRELAERGEAAFNRVCAECHGTYGARETYPERIVPLDVVGTDPLRLAALTPTMRTAYGQSWFGHYGRDDTLAEPEGYQAPPLDGLWASAPYFHNGSVPTLWHVLHPDQRPVVWRRTADELDAERGGLRVAEFDGLPADARSIAALRVYFDTRRPGKSAAGHDFPDALTEDEKRAVLEYLKTL